MTSRRRLATALLALVFLLAAAPALAGDRAFYLTIVDGSAQPGPADGPAAQIARALLRCAPQESLDACRTRIGPGNDELHDGDVQSFPAAPTLSPIRHGDAARNRSGARRALRTAYAAVAAGGTSFGSDAIIVIDVTATNVTVSLIDWETGRNFARVRRPLRNGALDARGVDAIVRSVMRPIARRFSP